MKHEQEEDFFNSAEDMIVYLELKGLYKFLLQNKRMQKIIVQKSYNNYIHMHGTIVEEFISKAIEICQIISSK